MSASASDLLDGWFGERARAHWFSHDPAFDNELRAQFGATLEAAERGELDSWADAPDSCLALVILLDQLSRNLYRGTPQAFANDRRARTIAEAALARGFDQQVALDRRSFFYMPLMHAEDIAAQRLSVELFERWAAAHEPGPAADVANAAVKFARRHFDIVDRFGRFPHRNALLGRTSTPDEISFLEEPMSSF